MGDVKRRERTRILVQGSPELRSELAREIATRYRVYTIADSAPGLVMTTMRETARRSRFYLGEVLVTEAKVQVNGTLGLGIIAGEDDQAALELAVIDAAYNASLPETGPWQTRLYEEANVIARRTNAVEARILETRVNFQTMDVD